jgi:hypothetical protein
MDRAAALAAMAVGLGAAGCVKDAAKTREPPPTGEVAVWDFSDEPAESTVLFPPRPGTPQRLKRHLGTRTEDERLFTVVEAVDPQLGWRFETPARAYAVHAEFEAAEAGSMQVFWATPRCPVYSEPCSATASFGPGRSVVEWLLDPSDPLRELRLDPPDHVGTKITFDRLTVRRTPLLGGVWQSKGGDTTVAVTPLGLDVEAQAVDPWITLATPGLEARFASAVELIVRGPSSEIPQLYWQPAGAALSEACSVRFVPVDSGALTHRVVLKKHPCWKGRIDMLRFDPGQAAGRYAVEQLALVQAPAD